MTLQVGSTEDGVARNDVRIDLTGRVALITGASEGLGAEIARHFARAGASLLICARSGARVEALCRSLAEQHRGLKLRALAADVSVPSEVDALFDVIARDFGTLDVVVNNAGSLGPIGPTEEVCWEEWVATFGTNLFGLANVTRHALPILKAKRSGKLINIGGGGVSSPMPNLSAYAASKAAVARFVETIAHECQGFNVDANVVAPGVLNTRMMTTLLAAGPERATPDYHEKMKRISEEGGVPLTMAAELCVFLASGLSDGITGKIISAKWDRWRNWPVHLEELDSSDVYTLRRITGRDRGMDWGDA